MKRMWSRNELLRLSDAEIRKLIESGEIDNAKPIYYHPIVIITEVSSSPLQYESRIQCAIFDNNSQYYIKETFTAKIKALMDDGAYININGYFVKNGVINNAYLCQKVGAEYRVYGNNTTGRDYITLDELLTELSSAQINDGVNKIN